MNQLAERKRLIVLQSDLHRHLLALECANLRARLAAARAKLWTMAPWVLGGGAVAALLAARRRRGLARWISGALTVWRLWKQLR